MSIPAVYPLYLLRLVERRGIGAEQLLHHTGLHAHELQQPDARVFAWQVLMILDNLRGCTADPTIAIEVGQATNITKAGALGLAMMSCATLGEVLELFRRFLPLQCPFFTIDLEIKDGIVRLTLNEVYPLQRFRKFMVENFFVEVVETFNALVLDQYQISEPQALTLHFDYPEPEHFKLYQWQLPQAFFNQAFNQIRFSSEMLDFPIATRNLALLQMIISQVESQVAQLGLMKNWVDRVRALLVCRDRRYPTLPDIAAQLHLSERTLKRKLAEHGLRYSDLLDTVRLKDATNLLNNSALRIEDISQSLGYQNSANFTKAFRRWTRTTPSEYRRRILMPSPVDTERVALPDTDHAVDPAME